MELIDKITRLNPAQGAQFWSVLILQFTVAARSCDEAGAPEDEGQVINQLRFFNEVIHIAANNAVHALSLSGQWREPSDSIEAMLALADRVGGRSIVDWCLNTAWLAMEDGSEET